MKTSIILVFISLLAIAPARAGWLDDAINNAVERTGTRAVDETADTAYDSAKGAENKQGNENQAAPAATPGKRKKRIMPGEAPDDPSITSRDTDTPILTETAYDKYDFVPGEKTIFSDDFSDTDVGEFPRKWTLKGPEGGGNPLAVAKYKEHHYLRSVASEAEGGYTEDSTMYLRLTPKGDMPQKFTVEFDAVLGGDAENFGTNTYELLLWNDNYQDNQGSSKVLLSGRESRSAFNQMMFNKHDHQVHHIAISVNGSFVKAYIDNQRVINDPDGITRPISHIGMKLGTGGNTSITKNMMFSNFRVAEGGKDIKSALDTEGKIVTHGILFDTGSDRIRPESAATLKGILDILNGNPALRFSIEGHTDNQGNNAANQPLSERRAAAVSSWLTYKGIAPNRLQSKGWGASRPIDTNDSAEGRANNRRVEFVKM